MPLKLSLTQQGLILVAVPLCFEVACVGWLIHLQREAEAEAQKARKSREIADSINRLNSELYETYNVVTTGAGGAKSKWLDARYFERAYKQAIGNIKQRYEELIALSKDKPEVNRTAKQAWQQTNRAEQILDDALAEIKAGRLQEVIDTHEGRMDKLRVIFKGLMANELLIVTKHEQDFEDAEQVAIRERTLDVAIIAVLISIGASIFFAIYIVKGITSRLAVMNDNTRRLAANKPLQPVLVGTDEIAELDRVFHQMASDIEETARMRQELVSMLTHDLRSPLNAIQGCIEMLEEGMLGQLNERGQKLVQLADRNGSRMMILINDLLDIQKIKSGMMTIDLSDTQLQEIFEDVRLNVADWVAEHDIKLEVADTDLELRANKEKLGRVVFNLVSNAIKFSPKGGTIKIGAKRSGKVAQISVSDQGGGIAKEMQSTIFEKFQQIDGEANHGKAGSGLGLTICQAIVGLHGGKIWVESEVGKGSTFIFTVPLSNSSLPVS